MWGVNAAADLGKLATLSVGYDKAYSASKYDEDKNSKTYGKMLNNTDQDDSILNVGLNFKFGKDLTFGGWYLHTDLDDGLKAAGASDNGFFLKAAFKGAKAAKPGSWGITGKYYHMPAGAVIANGWDTSWPLGGGFTAEGFKGFYAQGRVTVAKNMIAGIQYWDLKGRESGNKNKTTWADFVVTF